VVDVEVLAGRHTGCGRCLLEGGRAVVDLPGLAGPRVIPGAALPEWLAGLVGLGPRPQVASPGVLMLDRAALDDIVGPAAPNVAAVAAAPRPERLPQRWLELLAGIGAGFSARWRVEVTSDVRSSETLEVIDSADTGLWAVQPCPPELAVAETGDRGELVTLAPTTPTVVWAWLSRLAATG
jgi:hypothetical protein